MVGTLQEAPTEGASWSLCTDQLGQFVTFEIDSALFEKAAIFKAAYWGTERSFLYLSQGNTRGQIRVELRPKKIDSTDLRELAREFFNALIDQQTRQIVFKESSAERDTLLAKAFSAGRTHLDPSALK